MEGSGRNYERLRAAYGWLSEPQLRAALSHYQLYGHEVDARLERVLVTRNRADYLHWTREFYHAGRPHAGVLFLGEGLPNDRPEAIARALGPWDRAHSYAEDHEVTFGAYHVDFLQR